MGDEISLVGFCYFYSELKSVKVSLDIKLIDESTPNCQYNFYISDDVLVPISHHKLL